MRNYKTKTLVLLIVLILIAPAYFSQNIGNNYVIISPEDTPEQIIEKAANVTPSERQYEWQKLELTAFIHFGINTFTEVEWGEGTADISVFNPEKIDTDQWVKVLKDAGFKLIILTTKHHDGFCLWQSEYTDYDIANTPFMDGKGDVVKELSNSCKMEGIKFGVYLSPWDMHESTYGTDEYNKHFINQLTELLTNYGEVSEVWFDGACGEGPNGKRQVYDWQSYYKTIRSLQPEAVIAVMGPDVRWVGTESGYGRQTEWSVLPGTSSSQDDIAANSQQQSGDGAFVPRNLMDEDLGSRDVLTSAQSLIWYPAEIDVSIRPGWFYKQSEDNMVKTPRKLVDIYNNSVGLNGVLLLNVPPNKDGLIHENDIKSLRGMRYLLDNTFKKNLTSKAKIRATSESEGHEVKNILDDDPDTYWTAEDGTSKASIEIQLTSGKTFNTVMLQENILVGQRIEKFRLEYYDGQFWSPFAEGTTVGYKRIIKLPDLKADRVKIVIEQSRSNPTLSSFGLFKSPPEIIFEPAQGAFEDHASIKLSSDTKYAKIYYTLDGTIPTKKSKLYKEPVNITETTVITAIAVSKDKKQGIPTSAIYNKAKYSIEYKTRYDDKYPGIGELTLVDGESSSPNFSNGKWQGFNGIDMDVIIDLKEIKDISEVSAGFLQDVNSYIFLPKSLECSFSENGKDYSSPVTFSNRESQQGHGATRKIFTIESENKQVRYVRIKAKNIGVCPEWHKGAGSKAWLFVDEIMVD